MNNAAFLEFLNHEDIHGAKKPIVRNREVTSPNVTYVILDKSRPILENRRRLSHQADIFLDGSFAQRNAQLQELSSNYLRAPKRILLDQSSDDLYGFRYNSLICLFSIGNIPPIQAEQISMPSQECIRLDNLESLMPEYCASG
jgi:hypothetical protein